jgi:putative SOS response-associated peptidase YedK
MCGRFHISTPAADIAREFSVRGDVPNFEPRWNAAPTDKLPVVLVNRETEARRLAPQRWGLIPFWAKDAKIGATMINAMAETVATRPAFKGAFQRRRCLVPPTASMSGRSATRRRGSPTTSA